MNLKEDKLKRNEPLTWIEKKQIYEMREIMLNLQKDINRMRNKASN